jgi:VanZ family protein
MIKKNILSFLVALIIMFLSLAGSDNFDGVPFFNIPYFDKIAHLVMYFGFMSVLLFENRKQIIGNKQIILLSAIPFFYGIMMELFQIIFTVSRTGSIYDVIFNSAGILVSALLWSLIKPFGNKAIK